uniref:(northern house mosquito) hypothetical protein n=1 Tax=Culex pipiens TaxID=7175 RepID=A0A8D8NLK4_CULPI
MHQARIPRATLLHVVVVVYHKSPTRHHPPTQSHVTVRDDRASVVLRNTVHPEHPAGTSAAHRTHHHVVRGHSLLLLHRQHVRTLAHAEDLLLLAGHHAFVTLLLHDMVHLLLLLLLVQLLLAECHLVHHCGGRSARIVARATSVHLGATGTGAGWFVAYAAQSVAPRVVTHQLVREVALQVEHQVDR